MRRQILSITLFITAACGQSNPAAQVARQWRQQHERAIMDEFVALLSIPNIASDRANIQRNAETIAKMLEKRGVASRLVSVPGANPVVFGQIQTPGATRTIVLYAHYDGQPLDPKEWATPPFTPVLRDRQIEKDGQVIPLRAAGTPLNPEWRLYARGAADDKAPILAMMAALDAIRAAGLKTKSNIKLVFEGEEEAYSVNLERILAANKEMFSGDIWLICDGPVSQTRRQSINFGARGFTAVDIVVYGPRGELHSGHYGNWAPNPIVTLTHLIDSMRDTDAHILIKGFYDDVKPLTDAERAALAAIPPVDEDLKREMAIGRTEGAGKPLNEQILMPALNLRGISGGHVGEQAANAISTEAKASIDFRLVPAQTPDGVRRRVEQHVADQGFFIVHDTPDAATRLAHANVVKLTWGSGYPAARTAMDLPLSVRVAAIVGAATGTPVLKLPSLGGSVPMYLFQRGGTAAIGLPIANHDNNQHAANENIRIQNLWDGIEVFAALFSNL